MANEYKKIILKNLSNMTGEEIDNFNIWFVTREKTRIYKTTPKRGKNKSCKKIYKLKNKMKNNEYQK
jgi:hypothetical protein